MNKRFLSSYLPFLLCLTTFFTIYSIYEISRYGFWQGMHLVLLAWSFYVLCVPAAHGRLLIGAPIKLLFKRTFFPEPYLWVMAAVLNILTIIFSPLLYTQTLPTYLLYRILTVRAYWIILVIAMIGTWYRVICGTTRYAEREKMHTIIRHLILLIGLFILFYLTNYDVIVMINVMTSA